MSRLRLEMIVNDRGQEMVEKFGRAGLTMGLSQLPVSCGVGVDKRSGAEKELHDDSTCG